MAIAKKSNNNEQTYTVNVTRAKDFTKDGGKTVIGFDMTVNGIQIYGCWYRVATNKQGEDFASVSFPSHKGADDKYYNYAWFNISETVLTAIEKQIEALI